MLRLKATKTSLWKLVHELCDNAPPRNKVLRFWKVHHLNWADLVERGMAEDTEK